MKKEPVGLRAVLVRAISGSLLVRLAGMAFAFLVGVQLARRLGPAGYGTYGLAMSYVSILLVLTQFGLPPLLVRELARTQAADDFREMRGVLRWADRVVLLLSLGSSLVLFLASLLLAGQLSEELRYTIMAGSLLIPAAALAANRGASLQGLQLIVRGQLPDVVLKPGLLSLFLTVLWLMDRPLAPQIAMLLHAAAAFLAFAVGALMLRLALPGAAVAARPAKNSGQWRRSAIPFLLSRTIAVVSAQGVLVLMGWLATVEEVGLYKVAFSVSAFVALPYSLLTTVSAPILARFLAKGDSSTVQRYLGYTSLLMVLGTAAASLPFLIAGDYILVTLFGSEYEASTAPLRILCGGMILSACFGANATVLNMAGHESRVTRRFSQGLVVLGLLAPPLTLTLGPSGAAAAAAASTLTWNIAMWHDAKRLLHLDTLVTSFKR